MAKYQLERLNDIDIFCGIGFLINCKNIDKCHSCKHLLKSCIKVLLNRWDEIRFINFFEVIKILKQSKELFREEYDFAKCWHNNKLFVKKMIKD